MNVAPDRVKVPTLVSVPLLTSVPPGVMVLEPESSHVAPLSTVTDPKLAKLVPRPVIVPVLPPDASSSVLLAPVLPLTLPLKTAPGSTTSRSFAVPAKETAVPPLPAMVPAFVTVPPELSTTPTWPAIDAEAALVTEPPAPSM